MLKLFGWCKENILLVMTLILLAFIPLYPKLPLFDIPNTWVYVRAEDFFVLTGLAVFTVLIITKTVHLKTPLTMPFFVFWIIGGFATLHGVLLIFPGAANIFANVALLSFLRRIEYMSVFFIAYWGLRNRKNIQPVIYVILLTVLGVSLYGIGQRYLGFPAFLTMNEEFAKGVPIQLSALSRIPSTFGGHYDLAAYLVLVLPIVLSLLFTVSRWSVKFLLALLFALGTYVLFLTVSRISLIALVVAGIIVLLFYNRKIVLALIPVMLIMGILLFQLSPRILDRIFNTVQIVDVLVDKNTGGALGNVKIVPNTYFQDKVIRQEFYTSPVDMSQKLNAAASMSGIIIPYSQIPSQVALFTAARVSTGEDLPHGTGYINLTLSPVIKDLNQFYFEPKSKNDTLQHEVQIINGPYLIKRTLAYDLSFTTRFQGEWPNTFAAFKKNIFLGSGYGSVSLAVDNSYLRMLGEVGILGTLAFLSLFVIMGIYCASVWKTVNSPLVKSFMIGVIAGVGGLFVNAFFIDVFEASKVAFSLWLLIGVLAGVLHSYAGTAYNVKEHLIRIVMSPFAIVVYLGIGAFSLFGPIISNYFVGDDFTWLRWAAAACSQKSVFGNCAVDWSTVAPYLTDAAGFFYRPGTKAYFLVMYNSFWLNQSVYHGVSIGLHFIVTVLVFFLSRRLFRGVILPGIVSMLFLIIAGYSEAVSWISATGFLFTSALTLGSLLCYISFCESKKQIYLWLAVIFSIVSPFFHELGIVTPLYILLYVSVFTDFGKRPASWKKTQLALLFIPTIIYLLLRFNAGSHWFSGDYSYNILKLPFNLLGNFAGYVMIILGGPMTLSLYESIRTGMRENIVFSIVLLSVMIVISVRIFRWIACNWGMGDRRIAVFGFGSIVVSLLPFLGLGNITSRYGYLATFGVVILFTFFLKKMYGYLKENGTDIAYSGIVLILGVFVLFHVIQTQRLQDNWNEAGETVRQFLVSIDSKYSDIWRTEPMEIHLIGTPLKRGHAWVFPVGLPDAIWFAFQNPDILIFQNSSVEEALSQVSYDSPIQKVFEFNQSGELKEHIKARGRL